MPWTLPPQPALATDRLLLILNALWEWVGKKAGPAMTSALHLAIRAKLYRTRVRFAVLAKRFHEGMLTPPTPRATPRAPPATPRTRAPSILPRHFGWLCGLVPCWAAGCGSQLQHLLDNPELAAMAAASPEVGRLIRPLLWMTGRVPPAYLALSPRTKRARAGLPPGPCRPRRKGAAPPPPPIAPAPIAPVQPPDPNAAPPSLPRNPNRPPPPPPDPEPERWGRYRFHPNNPLKGN